VRVYKLRKSFYKMCGYSGSVIYIERITRQAALL